eukprot:ctg_7170.g567
MRGHRSRQREDQQGMGRSRAWGGAVLHVHCCVEST